MKTCVHLWYLAEFFLEWEMFQTKVVIKIKTHIFCSVSTFRRSCRLWGNAEKYGRAKQATNDNIIRRMRVACWITKATVRRSEYAILTAFPRQQWFLERPSMLRLYVQCLSFFFGLASIWYGYQWGYADGILWTVTVWQYSRFHADKLHYEYN
jgi:hypothetical protein